MKQFLLYLAALVAVVLLLPDRMRAEKPDLTWKDAPEAGPKPYSLVFRADGFLSQSNAEYWRNVILEESTNMPDQIKRACAVVEEGYEDV